MDLTQDTKQEKLKSCHNCANIVKYTDDNGVPHLSCDEYGFNMLGFPANCDPPHDDACKYWTDDPKKANKWRDICARSF